MFDNYIGQHTIVRELKGLSKYIRHNIDSRPGYSVLLSGAGGFGKTHLARQLCTSLGVRYTYQVPTDGFIYTDDTYSQLYAHIVDEIHLAKNSELLYPMIDSKKYLFVFCTTDPGLLNEPFLSRNMHYRFGEYTTDELVKIIMLHATDNLNITNSSAKIVAERCRGNPRVAITYTKRVILLIYAGHYPNTPTGVASACKDIGIYDKGYTELDMKYLDFLSTAGEANLTVISNVLKTDKLTIRQDVEPFLIERGHITMTPRGRRFLKGL